MLFCYRRIPRHQHPAEYRLRCISRLNTVLFVGCWERLKREREQKSSSVKVMDSMESSCSVREWFFEYGAGCAGCTQFFYSFFFACCISLAHFRFPNWCSFSSLCIQFGQTLHGRCGGRRRQNHASLPNFRLFLWFFVCISLVLSISAHGTMTTSTILLSRIECWHCHQIKPESKIRLCACALCALDSERQNNNAETEILYGPVCVLSCCLWCLGRRKQCTVHWIPNIMWKWRLAEIESVLSYGSRNDFSWASIW